MDIKTLKTKKATLEDNILSLVRQFEKQTDITILKVYYDFNKAIPLGGEKSQKVGEFVKVFIDAERDE